MECLFEMLTTTEEQEQTLWIGNLPYWVDENYLCLCFFLFDSVHTCFQTDSRPKGCKLGEFVKIIKDPQTNHSLGYGFMTFKARDDAEKILHTYNGIKVMPGTKDQFFCLKWALERSKGEKPQYEYSKIRTMNVLNDQSQSQFENNPMQVQESANYLRSSSRLLYIPLDLIYDIFLRLPAESIMRLRSTCKAWASMTSTSHFTYQHLKNRMSHNDPIVALKDSNMFIFSTNCITKSPCSFSTLHFRFPYGFVTCTYLTLSNSCNGLVCVSNRYFINVVNPTIRETAQLRKSFAIFMRHGSTFSVGIGYDDSSDTYKIVRMYGGQLFGTRYEVFTLGGNSDASCNWRQLKRIRNYMVKNASPVFLNGAIHWLLFGNYYHENNKKSKVILSLDVRTDATRMLPIPDGLENCTLIELGGCLCIIENDLESKKANLYVLEDYASCNWIKKYTIESFPKCWRPVTTRARELLFPTHYYDMKNETSDQKTVPPSNYSSQMLPHYDSIYGCAESLISPISYLQRSNNPCATFPIFGQRWAAQFPNYVDPDHLCLRSGDTVLY